MSAAFTERSVPELIGELASLADEAGGGALAFDGDGTLWQGDVGEAVFHALLESGSLRAEAVDALQAFATLRGVAAPARSADSAALKQAAPARGAEGAALKRAELKQATLSHADLNQAEYGAVLGRALYRGYLDGVVSEREACELMAWSFAGWREAEVEAFAAQVVGDIAQRAIPETSAVLGWARQRGLRCLLISASPDPVVAVVGAAYGFAREDIAGMRPRVLDGVLAPEVERPSPYAEGKAEVGAARLMETPWLAAFGDSGFDVAMMRRATLGVGIRPRDSWRRAALGLPSMRVLKHTEAT